MCVCVCVCVCNYVSVGHFAVQQKVTQHCKSTIMEKNFLMCLIEKKKRMGTHMNITTGGGRCHPG